MLSKAIMFVFALLGIFGLLMVNIPSGFVSTPWNPTYISPEVKDKFDAVDILMYDYANRSYIERGYVKDFTFGLPTGQYLEVNWLYDALGPIVFDEYISLKHLVNGFAGYWYDWHRLAFTNASGPVGTDGDKLKKVDLEANWNDETSTSSFYAKCSHISTSIIFEPYNASWTIGESWDYGWLNFTMSYSINMNSTTISAWTIAAQLLSFQAPDLGIGGVGGAIVNAIIAIPTWSLIAYLIFKLITGIIPFLSGGSGD